MASPVAAGAMIGGTIIKGLSSAISGISRKRMAESEARYIRRLGAQEEREFREAGEEFKREQRAALGASGAVMGAGSPLQLQAETARKIEEDALKIRREYRHRAKQAKRGGQGALAEGLAGMGTTFLSGIERMYGFGQAQEWWK